MLQGWRSGAVARVLEAVGAACLVVLMVVVFVDVLLRNVFNRPLLWGTEVLEIVLAAMIFVLYPVLAANHAHITVDLIAVRPALRRLQRVLGSAMGVALFGLIAACLWRQTRRAADYGEATAVLGVPIAWILGGMALLAAGTAIAFAAAAWRATRERDPKSSVDREIEAA